MRERGRPDDGPAQTWGTDAGAGAGAETNTLLALKNPEVSLRGKVATGSAVEIEKEMEVDEEEEEEEEEEEQEVLGEDESEQVDKGYRGLTITTPPSSVADASAVEARRVISSAPLCTMVIHSGTKHNEASIQFSKFCFFWEYSREAMSAYAVGFSSSEYEYRLNVTGSPLMGTPYSQHENPVPQDYLSKRLCSKAMPVVVTAAASDAAGSRLSSSDPIDIY
ncbi:hypothetical protein MBM_00626 [Drepanopeziza brunnea f. sp. 'multigermtubi' MB_m1]|uniref:Uncharacterized protein n=1 Tax=Marssonina brunnea f. sp. multigermtubi (strain MB_m1) TaxID=1072389 RepID=K1XLS7_MARBU|nr:uncharacterized protein MBM_00626 [Drepanopeziza brunnea f. sp. 'multigermtubi' MB_m1]EKD21513.1 hypothetical protein MBM_00626 [Drepanopeziza brunnea f. sp. 'multigermtubi' MB_m1]